MNLFAQHGAQQGPKIDEGLARGLLDGVIFSPKDIQLGTLRDKLDGMGEVSPTAERLFDPQYYAIFLNGTNDARLGNLVDSYGDYFQARRRPQLERERQVRDDLRATLNFQKDLGLTGFIAPNILIPNSLNSIEAVIAKNFIRLTAEEHRAMNDARPAYATLAISRNALVDKTELIEFLNEITLLEDPPRGFYILIAARNTEARSDIYNADVIAAWMLINHVLNLNGFEVINGYSDILTPFLGAAGGSAGAFGSWSNLRTFSLDRFSPSVGGGRLPILRYLSCGLLNRITAFELNQLRGRIPGIVLNDLPTDALYDPAEGSEPQRAVEVVQSWDAVRKLNTDLLGDAQMTSLTNCAQAVARAMENYEIVQSLIRLDQKSNDEHLQPLADGLSLFLRLAELTD